MNLDRCINVNDMRARAKRSLPSPIFAYLDGGADDEWSLRNNVTAFDRRPIVQSVLRDVGSVDLTTDILGARMAMPLILSPTGMSRLFHHDKEIGVARAAAEAGLMYSLSTMATTSIEDIAQTTSGPKMFQIYILRDRGITNDLVSRCIDSGYAALCLTVDAVMGGNRERDRRAGLGKAPNLTPEALLDFALKAHWSWNYLRDPSLDMANLSTKTIKIDTPARLTDFANAQFDRSVTWDDAAALRQSWPGPFALKGVQTPEDALRAVDIGATALFVSNHGGRQLDGAIAPVDCIEPIRQAVGDKLQLICDGGVRRGTHILKALALGADACSIGRPYLYGLAAGGEAGVARTLSLLREETERAFVLAGVKDVKSIQAKDRRFLHRAL